MSFFAYLDSERTKKVTALEAVKRNHRIKYYCFNKNCNARMHVVQRDPPCFAADQSNPHVDNCFCAMKSSYDPGDYNEANFDFEKLIKNLLSSSESSDCGPNTRTPYFDHPHSDKKSISTLLMLYQMCKYMDIDDSYNSVPIKKIIFDSRCDSNSLHLHNEFRVIEAQNERPNFSRYDKSNMTITLYAPVYSKNMKPFRLEFTQKDLYSKIQNTLYNNMDKLFIVAGLWNVNSEGNGFVTTIQHERQVKIIK